MSTDNAGEIFGDGEDNFQLEICSNNGCKLMLQERMDETFEKQIADLAQIEYIENLTEGEAYFVRDAKYHHLGLVNAISKLVADLVARQKGRTPYSVRYEITTGQPITVSYPASTVREVISTISQEIREDEAVNVVRESDGPMLCISLHPNYDIGEVRRNLTPIIERILGNRPLDE